METVLVIHKGKKYKQEIEEAEKSFSFKYKKFQSITCHKGTILKIEKIKKK
jgi:16S rRNA G527 N7-methylase RsmG